MPVEAFVQTHRLGPDALDSALSARKFTAKLESRKGMIKAILMDQSFVAGIGNLYGDEILFQAGIHPRTKIKDLTKVRLERLHGVMREVLETAITCGAGSERGLDRLPPGYLLPQRRRHGHCPRCGNTLRKVKVNGRAAYFCPVC